MVLAHLSMVEPPGDVGVHVICDLYGLVVACRTGSPELATDLMRPFRYFERADRAAEVTIAVEQSDPPYRTFPRLTASFSTPRNIVYRNEACKIIDYFGKGVVIEERTPPAYRVFSRDVNFLREAVYLLITALFGGHCDRAGLLRVHALALAYGDTAILLPMPPVPGDVRLHLHAGRLSGRVRRAGRAARPPRGLIAARRGIALVEDEERPEQVLGRRLSPRPLGSVALGAQGQRAAGSWYPARYSASRDPAHRAVPSSGARRDPPRPPSRRDPIGPTTLWEAVRHDVADALYDQTYREVTKGREPAPRRRALGGAREALARNLWQGQVGQEFLVGLLSARLGRLGDVVERGVSHVVRRRARPPDDRRADVLVAGSLYRAAVAALGPVLMALGRDHGLTHLVVAHDDVLLRHTRAFRRLELRWRHAAAFSEGAHGEAAREIVARARPALADPRVPPGLRSLSVRSLRRLIVNFLAAREALRACDPSVVVIPDERQPLARLVGLEARGRGLAVVSAPLARDQLYRKTPLWDAVVSTRVLVFSPLAARFLARAGAPAALFEPVASVPPEPAGARTCAARSRSRDGARARRCSHCASWRTATSSERSRCSRTSAGHPPCGRSSRRSSSR